MSQPGTVVVVGIGPGASDLMTPRARAALVASDVLVGYAGYVALVGDLVAGKECHALPLGQEIERARLALDLAGKGRCVSVISSGDPGVYGMAGVVLELLRDVTEPERPEVIVVPGVSALMAAASLLGAPLGHDFAVISLSDLHTPWDIIARRLEAAAGADFVIALLNPKSRQRAWQLDRAREIILRSRNGESVVGVVRNAYRPEQGVVVTTLGRLHEVRVDMFTTVIIGNSCTVGFQGKIVTPRGIVSAER